jgi:hypothetical protein
MPFEAENLEHFGGKFTSGLAKFILSEKNSFNTENFTADGNKQPARRFRLIVAASYELHHRVGDVLGRGDRPVHQRGARRAARG